MVGIAIVSYGLVMIILFDAVNKFKKKLGMDSKTGKVSKRVSIGNLGTRMIKFLTLSRAFSRSTLLNLNKTEN